MPRNPSLAAESGGLSPLCRNVKIKPAVATGNNVSLSEPLLAEMEAAARAEHRSVDEVVGDAVKKYLENRSWVKMLEYGQSRAKALGYTEDDVERLIAETRAEKRSC